MQASTKIIAAAILMTAGCASTEPPPPRFASIAKASDAECVIVRTALSAVLNEEPYFAKPAPAPAFSYIAVTPYLAADMFGENPYEALRDTPPVNLAPCVGLSISGPRGRIMGFTYPERIRNDRVVDPHGWIARPMVEGDRATVLLNRGQCYRVTTVELARSPGSGWRATAIRHAEDDVVWTGRHPCDPWP